jgi:hypothetical protein
MLLARAIWGMFKYFQPSQVFLSFFVNPGIPGESRRLVVDQRKAFEYWLLLFITGIFQVIL